MYWIKFFFIESIFNRYSITISITRDIRVSLRNTSIFFSYFPNITLKTCKNQIEFRRQSDQTIHKAFQGFIKRSFTFSLLRVGIEDSPSVSITPPPPTYKPTLPPAACHSLAINTDVPQVTRLFLPVPNIHCLFRMNSTLYSFLYRWHLILNNR